MRIMSKSRNRLRILSSNCNKSAQKSPKPGQREE